jgi:hypothetical protein
MILVLMAETCFQLCNTHSNKFVITAIKSNFARITVTKYQIHLLTNLSVFT